jgi:hypothetical protein
LTGIRDPPVEWCGCFPMPPPARSISVPPVSDRIALGRRIRCRECGDVIGVYEPLVVKAGDESRQTSLAAEPALEASDAVCFHRQCYELLTIAGVE